MRSRKLHLLESIKWLEKQNTKGQNLEFCQHWETIKQECGCLGSNPALPHPSCWLSHLTSLFLLCSGCNSTTYITGWLIYVKHLEGWPAHTCQRLHKSSCVITNSILTIIEHLLCTRLCARFRIQESTESTVPSGLTVPHTRRTDSFKTHTHTCRLTHSGQLPECDHCPLDILIFKKKPAHHKHRGHLEGLNVSCYCFALSLLALISLPRTLACTPSHACRFPHSSGPTWDSTLPPQMPPTQGCGRWACSEHINLLCRLHFQLPFLTRKGNYATTP